MGTASNKLYYRRGGVTYSIDLYTSTADFSTTDYFCVRAQSGGGGPATLYAPVGSTTDSRASYLRVYDGSTKAVYSTAIKYTSAWSNFGSRSTPTGYNSYSVATDYHVLYSSGSAYNIRIVFTVNCSGGETVNPYVYIDGTTYYYGSNVASGTYYKYFRLTTTTHTIRLHALYQEVGESGLKQFTSSGDRTVP